MSVVHMNKPYFVMMYNQGGESAVPLVDEDGDVMFWPSHEEAHEAGVNHYFASAFGFEVHEMGNREY